MSSLNVALTIHRLPSGVEDAQQGSPSWRPMGLTGLTGPSIRPIGCQYGILWMSIIRIQIWESIAIDIQRGSERALDPRDPPPQQES